MIRIDQRTYLFMLLSNDSFLTQIDFVKFNSNLDRLQIVFHKSFGASMASRRGLILVVAHRRQMSNVSSGCFLGQNALGGVAMAIGDQD